MSSVDDLVRTEYIPEPIPQIICEEVGVVPEPRSVIPFRRGALRTSEVLGSA